MRGLGTPPPKKLLRGSRDLEVLFPVIYLYPHPQLPRIERSLRSCVIGQRMDWKSNNFLLSLGRPSVRDRALFGNLNNLLRKFVFFTRINYIRKMVK